MGILDGLFGRRKYWEHEEKQGTFSGTKMHALSGEGKPHKETLIDFGPWCMSRYDEIVKALLQEKHRNILIDFSEDETDIWSSKE